jgi:alanyl aminopeptidase
VDLDMERVAVQDALGRRHRVQLVAKPEQEAVRLDISPPLPPGMATVYLSYSAAYAGHWAGLYKVDHEGRSYVMSQLQPMSARRVLPCFDEPRFHTPFNVVLTVPSDALAVTNAAAVGVRDAFEGRKTWAFEATPPLPTHLLAFVVGPLEALSAHIPISPQRPYTLDLRGFAAHGQGPLLSYGLGRIGHQVQDLEAYVDMPYPFTKLDVVAAPKLMVHAEESAAQVSLRDWLLLMDGPHAAYHKRRSFEMTMAQSLAHQWFGNWVTPSWWDDLWLHEAFATWRGLRTAGHTRPGMQFDLELLEGTDAAMQLDGLINTPPVRQPYEASGVLGGVSDVITSAKGAALLHMFEHSIGKDRFREGVRAYLRRYPYQSVTTQAFLAALQDGAEAPELPEAMRSFLDQAGVPEVTFAWRCDGATAELQISQDRYQPLGGTPTSGTWKLPVCFRAGGHADRPVQHPTCVQLTESSTTVALRSCPVWLTPNADGAGYYRTKVAFEQWPATVEAMTPALMSAPEWFAALDNLTAALASGAVPADSALGAISRGLSHPNPRIVRRALALLRSTFERHVPADAWVQSETVWRELMDMARQSLVAATQSEGLLTGAVHRVGAEADALADRRDELSLLRHDITAALATVARDSGVRAGLAHAGAHWLDHHEMVRQTAPLAIGHTSSGPIAATLLPDDVALALSQAALALGAPFRQRLMDVLATETDSEVRRHVLVALGSSATPDSIEALLRLSLDERLQPQERLPYLQALGATPAVNSRVWTFVSAHWADCAPLLPAHHWAQMLTLAESLCDAGAQDALSAVLEAHGRPLPDGPGALGRAVERNVLCAAQKVAQGPAVQAFFMGQPGGGTSSPAQSSPPEDGPPVPAGAPGPRLRGSPGRP